MQGRKKKKKKKKKKKSVNMKEKSTTKYQENWWDSFLTGKITKLLKCFAHMKLKKNWELLDMHNENFLKVKKQNRKKTKKNEQIQIAFLY